MNSLSNIWNIILLLSMMSSFFSKNPVKMSMMLMIITITAFSKINLETGMTWIPLMMILLFTGGILIMFLILSSFQPNEESKKMKIKFFMISSIILTLPILTLKKTSMLMEWNYAIFSKMYFMNLISMFMITMLITIYFCSFLKIMKKEKNCMRMILCYKMTNL